MMKQLHWCQDQQAKNSIIKVPLHFLYPPVETLSKELTRLNSNHQYRIVYLGPRWENSVVFHKKYSNQNGYQFDHRRVNNNNNLLSDTMNHNQFYRNELYYRAFEGMNPTLNLRQELTWESRFQSGNLDCVVKVKELQYDLFLRIDSNTRVLKVPKEQMSSSIFAILPKVSLISQNKGLHPFLFSPKIQTWSQQRTKNVTFQQKKLRYQFLYQKIDKLSLFYELAFEIEFEEDQQVKIAYSIPYTYTDLLSDLKLIAKVADIQVLDQSLTGIDIPVVSFGALTEQICKPVVIITGRIHPSETNSSWMLSNLMKQLSFNEQMRYLREKMLIIIIPMINPDGVILGNSRTGASGKDLNRQFKTKNRSIFPQITSIKKLVRNIQQTHIIEFYFDFHGHSRRKNVFMFGPNYNITQSQYYKCRVFPKMLSEISPIFRYYGCNYEIPNEKKGTARSIMLSEMMIPFVFTIQASLGFFDAKQRKGIAFDRGKWQEFGYSFLKTLRQYQEGIEQMQQFSSTKKKQKSTQEICQKQSENNKKQKRQQIQIQNHKGKKAPKMLKFYDLIAAEQNKKAKQAKKQKQERYSDAQSDSNDQRQQLQKQKMCEFMQMVTEFVQVEQRKREKQLQKISKDSLFADYLQNRNKFKLLLQQRIKQNSEFQSYLFKSIELQSKQRRNRKEIKTEDKLRKGQSSKLKRQNAGIFRSQIFSHLDKRQSDIRLSRNQLIERSKEKLKLKEKQDQKNSDSLDRRSQKLNLRMFNFSKMIQSPEKMKKYQENTPFSLKNMIFSRLQKRSLQKKVKNRNSHEYQKSYNQMESIQVSLQEKDNQSREDQPSFGLMLNHYNTEEMKKIEAKHRIPSNFYRIKHYQLLKKNQYKGKIFSDAIQDQKAKATNQSHSSLDCQMPSSPSKVNVNEKRKYAKISQFPIL